MKHRTAEQIARDAIASLETYAVEAGSAGHDALAAYLYKAHCGAFWSAPAGQHQALSDNPSDREAREWVQSMRNSNPEAIHA